MLLCFALTTGCPPLLQPNAIYRLNTFTYFLLSLTSSLSLSLHFLPTAHLTFFCFLLPPSFFPCRLQLCSLYASLDSILFPSFLPSFLPCFSLTHILDDIIWNTRSC